MIEIIDKVDCCGCNACGDICAQKAITFKNDEEGFGYPEINNELCTDCHLCEKICPILNIKELKKNDYEKPLCYAAQTKNLESLFNSTSGSAFATLAEKMYKLGGYVGGAIFNDDYSVKYNPQIQISAESGTKRSIFRQKNKTKRSKKRLHTTLIKPEQKVNEDLCSGFIVS